MLDHQGNCLRQGNYIRQFTNHSGLITMVDMDDKGNFLASCSHDKKVCVCLHLSLKSDKILMVGFYFFDHSILFKVIIQELYNSEPSYTAHLDAPIRCVSIEPNFSNSKSRKRFVVGKYFYLEVIE